MISTHYGSGDGASETVSYNVLSKQRSVLSDTYSAQLVVNASMTEVAIGVDASDTSNDVEQETQIRIAEISSQTRNGLALNVSAQAGPIQGCNPEWSPDDVYLVTTSHVNEFCLDSIDGVSFTQINSRSNTVQLPIAPAQISLPIGWVSQR
ncbi:MAG: hypothetical protein SF123_01365 [Chloroflexota bacterium]|nr:hypothetical protein [Chloroflexota bacterium]